MGSRYDRFNCFLRERLFSGVFMTALCLAAVVAVPANWSRVESKTMAWLRAVYFIDESTGWIGGSNGTFLTTLDGGRNWKQEKKFTNDNIRDVYFSDKAHGWLLCDRGIYDKSSKSATYLLRTSNGGSSWQPVELSNSEGRLLRFFFTRDGYGYAVGEGGALWQMLDDKETWKRVELPVRYLIMSVVFLDDFRGVLVGGGGTVLFTTDGGVLWQRAAVASDSATRLNSVAFVDRENGWAVGGSGRIFVTTNGGKLWRPQSSNTGADLLDVFFVSSKRGAAVGGGGSIVETSNGGQEWVTVASGVDSPLERVFFTSSAGFAVGYGGVILANRTLPAPPSS